MQQSVACWLVVMFLALLHSKVQCGEKAEILCKLAYIDEKLDKVLSLLNDMSASSEELATTTVPRIIPDDTSTSETEPLPPLELLEARREMVGESLRFTVRYKTELDNINVMWSNDMEDKIEPGSEVRISENVLETSYTQNKVDPSSRVHLIMELPTEDTTIYLFMGSGNESDVVNEDIELPVMEIVRNDGSGELVYDEGNDVTFKVRTSVNTDRRPVHIWALLLDLDTGIFTNNMLEYPRQYDIVDQKNESYGLETTLRLKTAKNATSGYLAINGEFVSVGEPEMQALVSKGIELRPSSAESTFPPDILQFVPNGYHDVSYDAQGNVQMVCSNDASCKITCLAVGYNIVDLSLRKVSSDGALGTTVNATEAHHFQREFLLMKGFAFNVDENSDGELYACFVKNSHGHEAQKRFVIKYAVFPKIDRSMSEITVTSDEDAPVVELTVSCIVSGNPKPKVEFAVETSSTPRLTYPPDSMVQIGDNAGNVYNATKVVTYGQDTSGLRYVECSAKVPFNGQYYPSDFLSYDIPSMLYDVSYSPWNITYYYYI